MSEQSSHEGQPAQDAHESQAEQAPHAAAFGEEAEFHEELAPRERLSAEEADNYPMPTPEQVAKSMARALRFQNACPHQEELARQIAEGRKMARAEKDGRGSREERQERGQGGARPERQERPAGAAGSKRRRNRGRSRSGSRAPQAGAQAA